jgi:F-type H+-transporting ATPase subunit delta
MREPTIARSYADTLVALATRAGANLDAWGGLIAQVADAIREDQMLRNFLDSPRVPIERKGELLVQALQDRMPRLLVRFLQSVVTHRRQHLIPEISDQYRSLVDQLEGRVHAEVAVAREPDGETRRTIERQLQRVLGQRIVAHYSVKPELLGGTIVRVGDTVMDGSVRRRLAVLRRRMLGATARA